jgi:hypothetical protein
MKTLEQIRDELADNEIRKAIHLLSLALIKGHHEEKKLRAIRSKLYKDLVSIESSTFDSKGPLSLCLFRELGLK